MIETEQKRKLPTGWKWVKLGDVCEVIAGQSPPGSTYRKKPEGLPFFQGKADFGDLHPIARSWCVAPKKIALPGDILLSVRAPVGPTNVADVECCIGRGLAAIRCTELADRDFILYFFRLYEDKITRMGTGSTFQSINRNDIESLEIPLPPLPEQKRIAGILTEQIAAAAKAKRACQEKIEAAEKLPTSYLTAIFNSEKAKQWPKKKLGEVCEFKNGINFGAAQKGAGVLTVDVLNMYSNSIHILTNDLYRVDISLSDDYLLQAGDILIVRSSVKREGVGWPSFFSGHEEPMTFCGFIIRARLSTDRLFPQFMVYYLRQEHIRDQVIGKSGTGTITNISQSNLKQVSVPLPPLPEQIRIAGILTEQIAASQKVSKAIEEELKLINKLPASLLQKAFEGDC